jgi:hypothetical protein
MSGSRLVGFYSKDRPVPTTGKLFFDRSPAILDPNLKRWLTGGGEDRPKRRAPRRAYPAPLTLGGSIQPTFPSGRR